MQQTSGHLLPTNAQRPNFDIVDYHSGLHVKLVVVSECDIYLILKT